MIYVFYYLFYRRILRIVYNISLFAPLALFYTSGLNILLNNSLGIISMIKRVF